MAESGQIKALAKLYEFLSEFSERELLAAARMTSVPTDLRSALKFLASARADLGGNALRSRENSAKQNLILGMDEKGQGAGTGGIYEDAKMRQVLERIVLDPTYFKSSRDLVEQLNNLGLSISFEPKDGRKRILTRTSQALASMGRKEQKRITDGLMRLLEKDQTAGWFRVIRGEER
jgi:hypothetical protein